MQLREIQPQVLAHASSLRQNSAVQQQENHQPHHRADFPKPHKLPEQTFDFDSCLPGLH